MLSFLGDLGAKTLPLDKTEHMFYDICTECFICKHLENASQFVELSFA
jgi:hypothetical protein